MSPHREPLPSAWTGAEHTQNPAGQALGEAEGEGDSGFQEVGVCSGLPCPPLVSPERAKEALMLGHQLVPMVGPQQGPVNDQLSTSYMDKARQASEYMLYMCGFSQSKLLYSMIQTKSTTFLGKEPEVTIKMRQLSRIRQT